LYFFKKQANTETSIKFLSSHLGDNFSKFFDKATLNCIAVETGFKQRGSKLKPWMFIESLLFNCSNSKEACLNDFTVDMINRYNVGISKQGIDNRFNGSSIKMAKVLLTKMVNTFSQMHNVDEAFEQFRSIRIKDSTSFELPENLAAIFPGNGGGSSKAGIRIQYEFDLKNNQTVEMDVSPATTNDYTNAWDTKDSIIKGDLIIRDLGYSSLKMLNAIDKKEAYYLNRIKSDVSIFEQNGNEYKRIDLVQIELSMRSSGIEIMEKQVYLGERVYMPTRMIIALVPEDKIEERIKKQRRKIERRKGKISKQSFASIGINLFATNANDILLPLKEVMNLYKIRWQIELVFKAWKTIGQIQMVKKAKQERVITMLYLNLVWIFMNMQLINGIASIVFKLQKQKLSVFKAFKIIKMQKEKFQNTITDKVKLTELIEKTFQTIAQKAVCENRKGRMKSSEIIREFSR
jgi:hypothetical protein